MKDTQYVLMERKIEFDDHKANCRSEDCPVCQQYLKDIFTFTLDVMRQDRVATWGKRLGFEVQKWRI